MDSWLAQASRPPTGSLGELPVAARHAATLATSLGNLGGYDPLVSAKRIAEPLEPLQLATSQFFHIQPAVISVTCAM